MRTKKYDYLKFVMAAASLIFATVLAQGCNGTNTNRHTVVVKQPDTVATQSPAGAPAPAVTLPTLDALFAEDSFELQLKNKLQLTDEQVQQLRSAASTSVSGLSEGGGNYTGSTRSALKTSDEQIRSIIGDRKAMELYQFIADRDAYGIQEKAGTQPNTIPADSRVVVNIPAYRMDVFQSGKLLRSYKIGIGYPEFPLPTGMRHAEKIIFNPTWTPPDEPWVKGKVRPGEKIGAGNKLNKLGIIKIPIGEPSLIHGGKSPASLGGFDSHGCVGLTNDEVKDFAMLLSGLAGDSLSADSMHRFEKDRKKTKIVKLARPIPVELRYETIVAGNGVLHIYRDVYEQGTNTLDNAEKVLAAYGVKYETLNAREQQALTQALDEMNRDAMGQPITGNGNDTAANKMGTDTNVDSSRTERAKKGKVTRDIKGQKEIDVPLPALQNKGYPEPVLFDLEASTKR